MKSTHFNRNNILRYDIRGYFGRELTLDDAHFYGRALAYHCHHIALNSGSANGNLYLGHDDRPSSGALVEALSSGFIEETRLLRAEEHLESDNDARETLACIRLLGTITSPFLYFCANYLRDTAENPSFFIIVTASHNEIEYNGFKILYGNQCLDGLAISELFDNYIEYKQKKLELGVEIKSFSYYDPSILRETSNLASCHHSSGQSKPDIDEPPRLTTWTQVAALRKFYMDHLMRRSGISLDLAAETEALTSTGARECEAAALDLLSIEWRCINSFLAAILRGITGHLQHKHDIVMTKAKAKPITQDELIKQDKQEHRRSSVARANDMSGEISLIYDFDADADRFSFIWRDFFVNCPEKTDSTFAYLMTQSSNNRDLILPSDWVLALLCWQEHQERRADDRDFSVLVDVKISRVVMDYMSNLGCRTWVGPTGHSIVKKLMQKCGAVLAGEASGHFYFAHEQEERYAKERGVGCERNEEDAAAALRNARLPAYDDALLAALRITKILANPEQRNFAGKLFQQFAVQSQLSAEFKINTLKNRPNEYINAIKRNLNCNVDVEEPLLLPSSALIGYSFIDGVRYDEPQVGWWLLRASNTENVLVFRYEIYRQAGMSAAEMRQGEEPSFIDRKQKFWDKFRTLLRKEEELWVKLLFCLREVL